MQEEILNFNEMVTNYYKEFGKNNMTFDFLHVTLNYTYVDLNSRLLDVNDSGIPVYNNVKRKRKELILIPVVLEKNDYEKLFGNDIDYSKRTFNLEDMIDVGTSYNFNYEKIYKKISEVIPKECHMISNEEISTIASMNGYENIFWDGYDENADMLPAYNMEASWKTKVYGVKRLEQEEKLSK